MGPNGHEIALQCAECFAGVVQTYIQSFQTIDPIRQEPMWIKPHGIANPKNFPIIEMRAFPNWPHYS